MFINGAGLRPSLSSVLYSKYSFAAWDRGIGAGSLGMSAPFCRSNSATANGLRGGALGESTIAVLAGPPVEVPRSVDVDEEETWLILVLPPPGAAGSAATRARYTACVERERSSALGFPRRASASKTFWMSFRLMLVSRRSSGCCMTWPAETYVRSMYFAVMKWRRCSRVDWGEGLRKRSSLASQIMLLTRLPTSIKSSMIS